MIARNAFKCQNSVLNLNLFPMRNSAIQGNYTESRNILKFTLNVVKKHWQKKTPHNTSTHTHKETKNMKNNITIEREWFQILTNTESKIFHLEDDFWYLIWAFQKYPQVWTKWWWHIAKNLQCWNFFLMDKQWKLVPCFFL